MAKRTRVEKGDTKGSSASGAEAGRPLGRRSPGWDAHVKQALSSTILSLFPTSTSTTSTPTTMRDRAAQLVLQLPATLLVYQLLPMLELVDASRMTRVSRRFRHVLLVQCTLPTLVVRPASSSILTSPEVRTQVAPLLEKRTKTVVVRNAHALGGDLDTTLPRLLLRCPSATSVEVHVKGPIYGKLDAFFRILRQPGLVRLHLPFQSWHESAFRTALSESTNDTLREFVVPFFGFQDLATWKAFLERPFAKRLERLECGVTIGYDRSVADWMVAQAALAKTCTRLVRLSMLFHGESISPELTLPSLRRLTLRLAQKVPSNEIHALLHRHPDLTHVELDGPPLDPTTWTDRKQIDAFFQRHPGLQVLRLSAQVTTDGMAMFQAAIAHTNGIRRMDFGAFPYESTVTTVTTTQKLDLLTRLPRLQSWQNQWLDIRDWSVLSRLSSELQEVSLNPAPTDWTVLRPLRKLWCLDVAHGHLDDDAMVELATYHPSIRYLRSRDMKEGEALTSRTWNAIAQHWPHLGCLAIDEHDMELDLDSLCRLLSACPDLEQLDLDAPRLLDILEGTKFESWNHRLSAVVNPRRIYMDLPFAASSRSLASGRFRWGGGSSDYRTSRHFRPSGVFAQ